jgi:hypothetical protein
VRLSRRSRRSAQHRGGNMIRYVDFHAQLTAPEPAQKGQEAGTPAA